MTPGDPTLVPQIAENHAPSEPSTSIYGRHAELDRITSLKSPVLVVAGDSGVGKSFLLGVATARVANDRQILVASTPVRLEHRVGALQVALYESLAEALARYEDTTGLARRWGRLLAGAAQRAADARVRDLVKGGGAYLLGILRARLGDPVADLVEDVASELSGAAAVGLSSRIAAQSDADVVASFRLLAGEVSELVDRPLMLVLDGAERLSEDDFRLLLDLAEQMPPRVHLVVSHSVASARDVDRMRRLETTDRGVGYLPLGPLEPSEVRAWLAAEQLEVRDGTPGDLEDFMTVTAGYPLHVDAAIAALQRGESVGSLAGERGFVANMVANYASLEAADQQIAARLAAFTDPPDDDLLLRTVELDEEEWAVRERRLVEARVFVTQVAGSPWFHELGRRAVWAHVLSDRQRRVLARRALSELVAARDGGWTLQQSMDVFRLVRHDPEFVDANEGVAAYLTADHDSLALVAALVELSESADQSVFPMGVVIKHARDRFQAGMRSAKDATGVVPDDGTVPPGSHAGRDVDSEAVPVDLIETLQAMRDEGLIVIAEDEQHAVVGLFFSSIAARLVALGRMASELVRVPVPRLATRTFETVLRPRLGEFHAGHVGIGSPTITKLAQTLNEADMDRDEARVSQRRSLGIMMRPRLGQLDLYAAILFDNVEQRDQALAALADLVTDTSDAAETPGPAGDDLNRTAGLVVAADAGVSTGLPVAVSQATQVFGEDFRLDLLEAWPHPDLLPEFRFADAVQYLTSEDHTRAGIFRRDTNQPTPADLAAELDLHVRTAEVIRSLAGPVERHVLGLDRPYGLAFVQTPAGVLIADVHGRATVTRVDLDGSLFGTRAFVELERLARINRGETIGAIRFSSSHEPGHPLPGIVADTVSRFRDFNKAQRSHPLRVPLDQEALQALLQAVHDRTLSDATALADVVNVSTPLVPKSVYVVVTTVDAPGRLYRDLQGGVRYVSVEGTPTHEVHVRVLDETESLAFDEANDWGAIDGYRPYFDIPAGDHASFGSSSGLDRGVGRLLGHERVLVEHPGRQLPPG